MICRERRDFHCFITISPLLTLIQVNFCLCIYVYVCIMCTCICLCVCVRAYQVDKLKESVRRNKGRGRSGNINWAAVETAVGQPSTSCKNKWTSLSDEERFAALDL
jgi:hypothetical protein